MGRLIRLAREDAVFVLLAFWIVQLVLWVGMMFVVQFVDRRLGQSVLYVTQISHWALVEAAATAAIAAGGLIQARKNSRRISDVHAHVSIDTAAIEEDIARLADLQPGPQAEALAGAIRRKLGTG